ncbi:bifunctional diguanylate cyclase/phosphohydrolase [Anaerosolibacter carboniphilus]
MILTTDLIFGTSNANANSFFETDLVLTGVFVLTAWLLGDYVKIEKNYREKLHALVNIDELTDVYNHRYFQEKLTTSMSEAEEMNHSVSLLFIDIDYFKSYNDLYGHLQGDKVLKNIAQILKNSINDQQTLARYGGEEFAVIAPSIPEEEAIELGEKIRCAIENTCFEGEENLPGKKLTISIGVSCFPDKSKTKLELINSADDALYRAKFFNKNRVEAYVSVLDELKKDIETEHIDLISSFKTLISVINAKDRYTYGHTERVVIYCKLIAEKLGLNEAEKRILKYGAYLHDIGKINIPIDILNKKTKLTFDEWKMIKSHPEQGIEILKHVPSLQDIIPLILHHHEKYDGTGYPSGLQGEEIPYLVRILSVADSFDAMTSNRPYQTRKDYQQAMEELQRCKAIQFDPNIVDMFVEAVGEKEGFIS